MPRVAARARLRKSLQQPQRALLLADARVKIRDAREDLVVARGTRFDLHQLEGARVVPTLHQCVTLLEHERGVVRRGANEALVLRDRRVDVAALLQKVDHAQSQIDLTRVDRERTTVRRDGLHAVARLFVERAEKREPREVGDVLLLELLHQVGQPLLGPIHLGHHQ